jgi:magnesium transporter
VDVMSEALVAMSPLRCVHHHHPMDDTGRPQSPLELTRGVVRGGVEARLFDADGHDRVIDLEAVERNQTGDRRLLWVDVDLDVPGALETIDARLGLTAAERARVEADAGRARLFHRTERIHLTLESVEPADDTADDDLGLLRREVDLLASPGIVVTAHRGPVVALDRFIESLSGESSVGALQAAGLLSSLVDEVITGFHEVAEHIERQIDHLDQVALSGDAGGAFLDDLVRIRRRISFLRRTLAPHRDAMAALARPELATDDGIGQPWPGLIERIETASRTVDGLRDALLGTHDIQMGRAAQRANDVMKALTVVSAVFLPAIVLAGVMGMNFQIAFFDTPQNFYVVAGAMTLFGILFLVFARLRSWI